MGLLRCAAWRDTCCERCNICKIPPARLFSRSTLRLVLRVWGDADADHYFVGPETPEVPTNWDFNAQQFQPFKQGAAASLRATIFGRLRNPDAPNPANQPIGFAMHDYDHPDNPLHFLSLTRTQYALLDQWQRGHFQSDWNPPTLSAQELITPEGLDRAALENCAGGGFHPGIEVSWLARKKEIYREPFRIKQGITLSPGPVRVSGYGQ